ncbi:MAG TPA: hypothetical protein VGN12_24165 [Pirellulales bacterium]|jgi:hypothetical protein
MRRHGRQFLHELALGASAGLALIAIGALLLPGRSTGTPDNSPIVAPASADPSTSEYLIRALTSDRQDLDEEAVRTAVDFVARCNGN